MVKKPGALRNFTYYLKLQFLLLIVEGYNNDNFFKFKINFFSLLTTNNEETNLNLLELARMKNDHVCGMKCMCNFTNA
jgi:hypothetical protein